MQEEIRGRFRATFPAAAHRMGGKAFWERGESMGQRDRGDVDDMIFRDDWQISDR